MALRKMRQLKCSKCKEVSKIPAYQRKRKFCNNCSPKRELVCKRCEKPFIFYGKTSFSYYCDPCRYIIKSEQVMTRRAAKNPNVKIGVGSGGNQIGVNNHAWNPNSTYHGAGRVDNYEARSICFAIWPKVCVICGSIEKIHAHHVNGNWHDNRPSNIVPVCKRCHRGLHSRKIARSAEGIAEALFAKWLGGRIKIAEKIGNPEMWESEVKARNNGWVSRND